ncbi:MAG: hypothetical protein ACYC0Q_04590 [Eubacteriales bacterium]
MFFLDDPEVMAKIRAFWEENQHLEKEHLQVREELHKAEMALREDNGNEDLKGQIGRLKSRLKELDEKAPWITATYPIEFELFSDPH